MSLRRGNRAKGGQKHQNTTAFKPDLYGCTKRKVEAKAAAVGGVCNKCKSQIEWKKNYAKYKPLSAPRRCNQCAQKSVKHAYHKVCMECVLKNHVCAKCGSKDVIVESYPQTPSEQAKEEAEFKDGLRSLSERERRSLLRNSAAGACESSEDAAGRALQYRSRNESGSNSTECSEAEDECDECDDDDSIAEDAIESRTL